MSSLEESPSKLPLGRALLNVFLSVVLVSGLAWMVWLYLAHLKELRSKDEQYTIVAILQASAQQGKLKAVYLAEVLGLSMDQPVNLYTFDSQEAMKRLLSIPVIKKALVKKVRPGSLYIEYELRRPIAYLGDRTNTAIDKEGHLFPVSPFFTPKKLPIIFLGEEGNREWGSNLIQDKAFILALELIEHMEQKGEAGMEIKQIDISQAFIGDRGRKQIVVLLEQRVQKEHFNMAWIKPVYLRLDTEKWKPAMNDYFVLYKDFLHTEWMKENRETKGNDAAVIDLRISSLAFLKRNVTISSKAG